MKQLSYFPIKRYLYLTACLWLFALIAVLWLDKPLALAIHSARIDQLVQLRLLTEGLPIIFPLMIVMLLLRDYRSWYQRLGSLVYFSVSLTLSFYLKTGLKIIFGRYWPNTWVQHNLSLIHDGVFGFNWWQGFANQGSFPSGHSTTIAFCCCWLTLLLPDGYASLIWSLGLMVPLALISLNYHFLGDCLAGLGLGTLTATFSLMIFSTYVNLANNYSNHI